MPHFKRGHILVARPAEWEMHGEWRGSDRRTFILLSTGLTLLLISSTVAVGLGGYLAWATSQS